jgi:threonine/homoserine/homoserine lactone efflux protein
MESYLAFVAVAGLLTVTPGIDMALVARNVLGGGQMAGVRTSVGICLGLLVWGVVAGLGVAAILASSASAYSVLRWAGAAYLVFLGIQALWRSRLGEGSEGAVRAPRAGTGSISQGLISNLLNPKIAVFYTTVVAQLAAEEGGVLAWSLLLAGTHAALTFVWLTAYSSLLDRFNRALRRPSVRAWIERLTGVVLIAFGIRVATDAR